MAGELAGRLEVIDAELGDVRKRLERLYEALETSELTLGVLSPRIFSLRHRRVRGGLPRVLAGGDVPRAQGAHPQLR